MEPSHCKLYVVTRGRLYKLKCTPTQWEHPATATPKHSLQFLIDKSSTRTKQANILEAHMFRTLYAALNTSTKWHLTLTRPSPNKISMASFRMGRRPPWWIPMPRFSNGSTCSTCTSVATATKATVRSYTKWSKYTAASCAQPPECRGNKSRPDGSGNKRNKKFQEFLKLWKWVHMVNTPLITNFMCTYNKESSLLAPTLDCYAKMIKG